EAAQRIAAILPQIQDGLLQRAIEFRRAHTQKIDAIADFRDYFTAPADSKIHGGFALAHWAGTAEDEDRLQQELKVTVRCIPFDPELAGDESGKCIFTGKPSQKRVVFAKSY